MTNRLRQHERLQQRLRQATAAGDVVAIARLQQALAECTLKAAARAQATKEQRINLRASSVPARRRTKLTAGRTVVVSAGVVPAVAVFPPAAWAGWTTTDRERGKGNIDVMAMHPGGVVWTRKHQGPRRPCVPRRSLSTAEARARRVSRHRLSDGEGEGSMITNSSEETR